jgi:hypothetical protein
MTHEEQIETLEVENRMLRAQLENFKWGVHSCGPTCTKPACVAVREAVELEREACAKAVEAEAHMFETLAAAKSLAAAIRARSIK